MKLTFVIIALLLCWPFSTSQAQEKLMIGRPGKPAKYIFEEGDMLRFRLKGEKYWNKALIQGLYGDKIRLHYATISIHEIEAVDIREQVKGRFLKIGSALCVRAGIGFAIVDQFNRSVVRNEPGVDETVLLIGGALFSAGALMKLLTRKKVKIGPHYIIKISEY